MEKIIENEYLKVTISDKGAELVSLINKETGEELLWQADPKYWGRHAPLLFPNVGMHYKNQYHLGDKVYPAQRHGFIRDRSFDVVESSDNAVSLIVASDDESKEVYPYDFSLSISYALNEKSLEIEWTVENKSDKTMYFTIGAHPAFNTKPEKSDYCLYFPNKDSLTYKLLDPEYECAVDKGYTLELKGNRLNLNDELFEKDALVFDDFQISECILEKEDGTKILAVNSPDFAYYGIWSKPGAPFVCLEPWDGRADNLGFEGDLSEKEGIEILEKGSTYKKSFSIKVF